MHINFLGTKRKIDAFALLMQSDGWGRRKKKKAKKSKTKKLIKTDDSASESKQIKQSHLVFNRKKWRYRLCWRRWDELTLSHFQSSSESTSILEQLSARSSSKIFWKNNLNFFRKNVCCRAIYLIGVFLAPYLNF